ncbi:hypothetical protein HK100_003562 [Physocladia obscura]|uniref:Uncharacterized protein n=1 Tax=Physocladia obscura TaxID=109957 RepID=A0AAD5T7I0_9FUNG|nr:hypothetical protein HK100_003562 [Physocladia obscura]
MFTNSISNLNTFTSSATVTSTTTAAATATTTAVTTPTPTAPPTPASIYLSRLGEHLYRAFSEQTLRGDEQPLLDVEEDSIEFSLLIVDPIIQRSDVEIDQQYQRQRTTFACRPTLMEESERSDEPDDNDSCEHKFSSYDYNEYFQTKKTGNYTADLQNSTTKTIGRNANPLFVEVEEDWRDDDSTITVEENVGEYTLDLTRKNKLTKTRWDEQVFMELR